MYVIRKMEGAFALPEGAFDPAKADFRGTDDAAISLYPWDETGYTPEAHARAGWNEQGLHVLLYADEPEIRCVETQTGGRVCDDSCMEFFFMPFPEKSAAYCNCECSAKGVMHVGIGEGRKGRTVFKTLPADMAAQSSEHKGAWWAVCYTIPMAFLEEKFGGVLTSGHKLRGNFYKCDESLHPHFGVWNAVVAPKPDFHRPECFGEMTIE